MFQRFKNPWKSIRREHQSASTYARPKTRLVLVLLAVILLALAAGIFITGSGNNIIARPYIEEKLRQFAENMALQAAQSGDIATFLYDEIEIHGGLFDAKAIITNPRLEYTARLPFGSVQRTDISTTSAEVRADNMLNGAINVDFPEPFTVERSGYAPIKASFKTPPRYRLEQGDKQDKHELQLPPSMTLAPESDAEAAAVEISISYENPVVARIINHENASNSTQLRFENICISSTAEQRNMAISNLSLTSDESAREQGRRAFNADFAINGIMLESEEAPLGPYHVALKVDGEYALADVAADPNAKVSDLDMNIHNFKLATDEYEVAIKGNVSSKPDDHMMFGQADVQISGLHIFRNSAFIPMVEPVLKDTIIGVITGNADVNATEASIQIKREKLGTLFIGNTSFENLVGMIVMHSLARMQDNPGGQQTPPLSTPIPEAETL